MGRTGEERREGRSVRGRACFERDDHFGLVDCVGGNGGEEDGVEWWCGMGHGEMSWEGRDGREGGEDRRGG